MMDGTKEAFVNFATSKGIFTFDPTKIAKQQIADKIKELGYDTFFDLENFEFLQVEMGKAVPKFL